jgi:hypothetical protein
MANSKCYVCESESEWGLQVANQKIQTTKWWCLGCIFRVGRGQTSFNENKK